MYSFYLNVRFGKIKDITSISIKKSVFFFTRIGFWKGTTKKNMHFIIEEIVSLNRERNKFWPGFGEKNKKSRKLTSKKILKQKTGVLLWKLREKIFFLKKKFTFSFWKKQKFVGLIRENNI
jgi:hypothetical protein